jgi:hypothetical protein
MRIKIVVVLMVLLVTFQVVRAGVDISPSSGPPGTVVTVTNTGTFSTNCGSLGIIASLGSASFTVPANATPGSVININCTAGNVSFTVTAPPIAPERDQDGDGLLDSQDACPFVFGVRENTGCPANVVAPSNPANPIASPAPQIVLPNLPTDGRCVVATRGTDRVNMRNTPTRDGEVVETIDPLQLYEVYVSIDNGDWYHIIIGRTEEPRRNGFVAGSVVRRGGDCSDVLDTDDTPSALDAILFAEMLFRRTTLDSRE